jgi:HEAT repeat protein
VGLPVGPRGGDGPGSAAEVARLDSPDEDVRYEAITRLPERHDPALIDTFARTLGDTDQFVRRQAAAALGDLDDPRCRPVLVALLDDPDSDIRYEAISGLRELLDESLIPALRERTDDTSLCPACCGRVARTDRSERSAPAVADLGRRRSR